LFFSFFSPAQEKFSHLPFSSLFLSLSLSLLSLFLSLRKERREIEIDIEIEIGNKKRRPVHGERAEGKEFCGGEEGSGEEEEEG
jgi:hypothetical protein